MASLNGQTIASSYEQLLHTDTDGGGNGNTLVTIKDGDNGTTFAIKLATNKVEVLPGSDDANAFEVSQADGTAVFTVNTSTVGATLVGALSVTGDTTITSATSAKPELTIKNTNADASAPELVFIKDSSSPADDDEAGRIYMFADDDGGNQAEAFLAIGKLTDVSNGSEDSNFDMYTLKGGTQKATLSLSSGSVGIGTTSPSSLLHIMTASSGASSVGTASDELILENSGDCGITIRSGNSDDGVISFADDGDHNIGQILYNHNSNSMSFTANDSVRMHITSGGNIGIGETSPLATLHVKQADSGASVHGSADQLAIENSSNAGLSILSGTSGEGAVYFGDSGDNDIGRIRYNHSGNSMDFKTNASVAMTIDSSGKVGIGTTSPAGDLEITAGDEQVSNGVYLSNNRNGNNNEFIYFRKKRASSVPSSGDTIGEIGFQVWDGDEYHTGARIDSTVTGSISNNAPKANLIFLTQDGSDPNPSERIRIEGNGIVGIGTNLSEGNIGSGFAGELLNLRVVNTGTHSALDFFWEHRNSTTGIEQRIQFHIGDDDGNDSYGDSGYIGIGKEDTWNLDGNRDSYLAFGTAQNNAQGERMRIASDGSVGIGETNPTTKLSVKDESATPVNIRRAASDGDVINLQRGSTGVAAIQIDSSSASFRNYSDRRLKKDFTSMNEVLEKINSINLYSYKLKIDESSSYGATAQELNDIFPELVKTTDDGTGTEIPENTEAWSISSDMNWILMKAIQELSAQNDALTARIEELENA